MVDMYMYSEMHFQTIVQSKPAPSGHDSSLSPGKLNNSATTSMESIISDSVKSCGVEQNGLHKNFRLWVTTRTDIGQPIPGK